MRQKLREGKHQCISHQDIINIIVMDVLSHLNNIVLWDYFMDMDRDSLIETQALTSTQAKETPKSSIVGRKEKIEEEEEEEEEKERKE